MNATDYDALVIGGGPGGSVTALHLLERGIRPAILEPSPFPRYHIGESLTGECGGAMRRLGFGPQMDAASFPVKHGVAVFGPNGTNIFRVPVMERRDGQLHAQTTWQVRRSDFDRMLLERALDMGAELLPWEAVMPIVEEGAVAGVIYRTPAGTTAELRAGVTIDASGQAAFLANRRVIGPIERGRYDKQVAVFSQVVNAVRDPGVAAGNTMIFYRDRHQWGWFIPLDDEVVSVGVVVPSTVFKESGLSPERFLDRELRDLNSEMAARVPDHNFVEPVRTVSNYSYAVDHFTGTRHLCVGDSHRFIDPIFSFGVNFAVREAELAAEAVSNLLQGKADRAAPFAEYEDLCNRGQEIIQDLVDCFWAHPFAFAVFAHQRYPEDIIDLFAGRIYRESEEPSKGLLAIRNYLRTHGRDGE